MSDYKKHIYFLREIISKGASSDDLRITNSLIGEALITARSLILTRELDKRMKASDLYYQKLCIDLEEVGRSSCNIPIADDCTILRSTTKIPDYVTGNHGDYLQVQKLDGTIIGRMTNNTNSYAKYSLAKLDKVTSYFMEDSYLYIINNTKLTKVKLRGIYSDPVEANALDCSGTTDFPYNRKLTYAIYNTALELLQVSYRFPEDTTNNAMDVQTALPKR